MPPKRHGKQDDSPAVDTDDEQQSNEPVMTITESMLQALVAGITRSQAEANRQLMQELFSNRDQFQTPSTPTPPPDSHAANGNFAKCTARFDGLTKNADVLEAFIDAIVVYKECTNVNDEHAVKGLPILLTGEAAIWWQGVKASVSSWEDALRRLRGSFDIVYGLLSRKIRKRVSRDDVNGLEQLVAKARLVEESLAE
ncbi:activity-regulated cytoskeleton associated protein 2-like, partial [Manduca sexta]|uniref:activity-regulated cytoskeleton associated protein 2-like n=1 Tax=Manduca sexta TaxID=7130 RepID=UPI00188F6988